MHTLVFSNRHKIHTKSLKTKFYTLLKDHIRKEGVRKDLVQRNIVLITVEISQFFFFNPPAKACLLSGKT